ncbi:hypothetical protein F4680DRAFT_449285 [Xylaria scruposa]|nr:hypothetical protein F4680DRAFT_449285 [Xylaria scruposa]
MQYAKFLLTAFMASYVAAAALLLKQTVREVTQEGASDPIGDDEKVVYTQWTHEETD